MKRHLILFLIVCFAAPALAVERTDFAKAFARIDEYVKQRVLPSGIPGVAVAITDRQGLLRVSTYGFADIKSRTPVKPETLFEIGSISKSFTAIALLQEMEKGKFDPQAPVANYLPWFRIHSDFTTITGHHLLTHTAGIPRDRDDIPSSMYQVVALAERSTGYPPGQHFNYSNIGYQVLGYLLEHLANEPYPDIIRKRIFEPLGMTSSLPGITHEVRPRLAVGYSSLYDDRPYHSSYPLVEATWVEYGAGDGSICSTASDLAAYARMLLNRGVGPKGRILSEESFQLLTQKAIPGGENSFYGYGLSRSEQDGHTRTEHSGGMLGYASNLLVDSSAGIGVVAFVNGDAGGYRPRDITEFVLKVMEAAGQKEKLPPLPPLVLPTQVPNASEYAGVFTAPDGKKLVFQADGERLVLLHQGAKIALETQDKDSFLAPHPDYALFPFQFVRDHGKVVEVTHGSEWYANDSYSGPRQFEPPAEWKPFPGHYRAQDPWFSNFRLVLRKGELLLITPEGEEEPLVETQPGFFRIGKEETVETIRLDTIVDGKVLRANLSGVDYYRVFTP